jgi:hypothetical protein
LTCLQVTYLAATQTSQIPEGEKLRLVMLFGLRYERDGRAQVNQLLSMITGDATRNLVSVSCTRTTEPRITHPALLQAIVTGLLTLASETKRTGDLFSTKNIFARASKLVGGLKVCRILPMQAPNS